MAKPQISWKYLRNLAREAMPTERGEGVEGGLAPIPRQEPQQFASKNGAFWWILNHESVGEEWLQT